MPHKIVQLSSVALIGVGLLGCARETAAVRVEPAARSRPPGPSVSSLAFRPVGTDDDFDIGREGRQTVAYAGYEAQVLSVTYTRQDDRQRWDRSGRDNSTFERRSVSTSVTVRGR